MSEVKWIKITTDMFDNRKIKHLRRLPDGNSIVLIWVMLLTLAGRCNAGGMVFLTENIPYTPKMLADELDFEENTVTLALEALSRLGMIQTEGFLQITNWNEYQNIDGLEKIREQTRQRVAKYRERKAIESGNATSNVSVTHGNAIELEEEKEKEKEGDKNKGTNRKRFTPPTLEEVEAYKKETNSSVDPQKFVDYYESKGWKVGQSPMKNWQAAYRNWSRKDFGGSSRAELHPLAIQNYTQRQYSGDLRNIFEDDEGVT